MSVVAIWSPRENFQLDRPLDRTNGLLWPLIYG